MGAAIGRILALFLLFQTAAPGAAAQDYPSKPIRVIVPQPPAGGTDIVTRIIVEPLAERLGQRIVVENKPGASGMIGAEIVARAAPDGYTLMVQPDALVLAPLILRQVSVDVFRDFAPIIAAASVPMVLAVHPSVPARSVAEYIALARARPGAMEYGSAGNGSPQHLIGEMFKRATGTDILHVPYKGASPAVADAAAGNVKSIVMGLPGISGQLKSGALVPLAVATGKRSTLLPAVPTLGESGIAGFDLLSWFAFLAPAQTPPPIVAKLSGEIDAVLQRPDIRKRLSDAGLEPVGGTPGDLARMMRADHARYSKIVAEANIKAD
jgi:tripartite-type tricarboxylate transporter receptor subunit TctC